MNRKIVYWRGIKATFGLMFRKPGNKIYILDLGKNKREIIHTFFCLEPIDIVLVDDNKKIIEMYKNVKPFRILFPKKEFRYVIEGKNIISELNDILKSL